MSLLPNCKEVARIISEGLDRDLGAVEQVRLRIHLSMCAGCTNFGKHMSIIRDAVKRWPGGPT